MSELHKAAAAGSRNYILPTAIATWLETGFRAGVAITFVVVAWGVLAIAAIIMAICGVKFPDEPERD
jgi:hypothetical protein